MRHKAVLFAIMAVANLGYSAGDAQLRQEIELLRKQTQALQAQLTQLQHRLDKTSSKSVPIKTSTIKPLTKSRPTPVHPIDDNRNDDNRNKASNKITANTPKKIMPVHRNEEEDQVQPYHSSEVTVHTLDRNPNSLHFSPTALVTENRVLTYIAGIPVIGTPYLGERPAFDGSDYIVNISSINRDVRLMQQRRRLYAAYRSMGYPAPNVPIISISGKTEPYGEVSRPYFGAASGDLNLGASEIDVAAAVNENVQAFMGVAYDSDPPVIGSQQRVANSVFNLNLGFVNIGNLNKTPFYFTAGQLYAPYGKYSSSMISSPLPLLLTRTKTRPFILGYKSQTGSGPYAATYVFKSDTSLGHSAVGGFNAGYAIESGNIMGDIGVGYIGSINDSLVMQDNGSDFGYFGGFADPLNGIEHVGKIPGFDIHGNISIDRYNFTAEWTTATKIYNPNDLSFNGYGARPSAGQLETSVTFRFVDKPASAGIGYQWTREALALNLPIRRWIAVFNISIWKDTVESIEYRHDIDYSSDDFANGIAPVGIVNLNTLGTGRTSDTVSAQIGVYF